MNLHFAPPHDTGFPGAVLILGLCAAGSLVLLAAIIVLEGFVFRRMLPGARAWRDSLIANVASSLLGIPIAWYVVEPLSHPGEEWVYVFVVATWGLSVAVEGGILKLLERQLGWRKILSASVGANVLSYGLMVALLFVAVRLQ